MLRFDTNLSRNRPFSVSYTIQGKVQILLLFFFLHYFRDDLRLPQKTEFSSGFDLTECLIGSTSLDSLDDVYCPLSLSSSHGTEIVAH